MWRSSAAAMYFMLKMIKDHRKWKLLGNTCAFFTLLKTRELVCEQDAENGISPLILYSWVYVRLYGLQGILHFSKFLFINLRKNMWIQD